MEIVLDNSLTGRRTSTSKSATLYNLNFHPLEVVSRYRDPQLQVGENYSCLFNLRPTILKY